MITENPEPLIAPCPFCGNEAQENFATLSDYIICSCGAAGPSALKVEDAVVRWNKRANPLPFREASEKPPDGHATMVLVLRDDRYVERCQAQHAMKGEQRKNMHDRILNTPYEWESSVTGWMLESEFVTAWKEGKAACVNRNYEKLKLRYSI